ncbi:hypothetical protein T265_06151 [Opisthorchis viverrini]|uniref:Uncharacterized protein n=1 Tax=Opisthorchis viverrini TaxID=6198 RepID=A0A075AEF1_OPIVI|nr:hypothetical protein T265_06151 [Opisthorchis viverrini]KER26649.1 hypothetical protein T265_06151 [Opisthorchis viverrini]
MRARRDPMESTRSPTSKYRKSQDFSLLILINKLSTNRESLRVSLEHRGENFVHSAPSFSKFLRRLFRKRSTPSSHPVACLRFTYGGPVADPV